MAIISSTFIEVYPQTSLLISEQLRNIQKSKPKVFNVFVKHSGLKSSHASKALQDAFVDKAREKIPIFRLEYQNNPIGGWAHHDGSSEQILLAKWFVEAIEKEFEENVSLDFIRYRFTKSTPGLPRRLPWSELAQKRGVAHARIRLFLESILLHEMVHWGRMISSLPSGPIEALSSVPGKVSKERGWMFVKEAYGDYLTPELLGI